jgi:hypothetical protein
LYFRYAKGSTCCNGIIELLNLQDCSNDIFSIKTRSVIVKEHAYNFLIEINISIVWVRKSIDNLPRPHYSEHMEIIFSSLTRILMAQMIVEEIFKKALKDTLFSIESN